MTTDSASDRDPPSGPSSIVVADRRGLVSRLLRSLTASGGGPAEGPGADRALMDIKGIIRQGYLVLAVAGVAVAFAAFAPLESAIVAHGEIVVKTHRKTIQHLEGHTFLDLPLRAGRSWSISEVAL